MPSLHQVVRLVAVSVADGRAEEMTEKTSGLLDRIEVTQ